MGSDRTRADVELDAATLRVAYWTLREHASRYRATPSVRRRREQWEASDRSDPEKTRHVVMHEWYARGIEAAARDLAKLPGMQEHEIEPLNDEWSATADPSLDHSSHSLCWVGPSCPECPTPVQAIQAAEARGYARAVADVHEKLFGCEDGGVVPPDAELPAGELMRLLDELRNDYLKVVAEGGEPA